MKHWTRTIRWISGAFLTGLAAMSGCAAKQNTELLVGVQTNVRVPTDINSVTFNIYVSGVVIVSVPANTDSAGNLELPGSLGVIAGADPTQPIVIEVVGYVGNTVKVLRRAQTTFVAGKTLYLRMPLTFACYDSTDCGSDLSQTCVAGSCVDSTVDSSKLEDYTSTTQFLGNGPGSDDTSCFQVETCLTPTTPMTVSGSDVCTVNTPTGVDPDGFTPVLTYASTSGSAVGFSDGSGTYRVPVDHDAIEGWEFVDSTKATLALVPGLCAKMKSLNGHLEATTACGDKTFARPLCAPLSSGAGGDDASTPPGNDSGTTGPTDSMTSHLDAGSTSGCPSGMTSCGGSDGTPICVDPMTDPNNCGMCGRVCPDCSGGACPTSTDAGTSACVTCLSSNCDSQYSACLADSTCSATFSCLVACAGGPACDDACLAKGGDATQTALISCSNMFCEGPCPTVAAAGDASTPDSGSPCIPKTCAALGLNCGSTNDGCGDLLDCGSCPLPKTCGGGGVPGICGGSGAPCTTDANCASTPATPICDPTSMTCVAATPDGGSSGGTCAPATCTTLALSCGLTGDGCSGTINCGSCPSAQTCGGGGVRGQCGTGGTCTPWTKCISGWTCGEDSDGCGGLINCGTCTAPQTCGGGGKTGQCG